MEVAGLVIGAVGIVGAFKDAIDLFALFTASRDFGQDYVILLTKLDIEKFILLQWAEQVGLLRHNFDEFDEPRLNKEEIQVSVARILSCIQLLLGTTSQLKERYGVKDSSSVSSDKLLNVREEAATISGPCMERFEQQFRKLKISIKSLDKNTSMLAKARWVIQDKARFGELVSELAHFTTKLREIVPPPATTLARTAELNNTKDLEQIHDLSKLKTVLVASTGHYGAIAGPTQKLIDSRCQARILRTLWFRKMDDRRGIITPAHKETFHWALDTSEDLEDRNNFTNWLRSESGIYWVHGKAGSGKSTLMKYIHSSPQTLAHLSTWAKSEACSIADFFFYYLGTPEQNTQEGLSNAMLFKIFSRFPALLSEALPNLWREANDGKESMQPPSAAEVKYAVEVISSYEDLPPFCLFIDGLDEYVGDFQDGLAFINRLAMNPKIKIVVSSRPEPHCVAAFEDLPKMKLQALTRKDIASYVQEVIGENKYMIRLIKNHPEGSKRIMNEIIDKASGVFLWVILACRSLIAGFNDYDRIDELQRRVEELPEELKDMFAHMLQKVDKRHAEQAARLLRLCLWTKNTQAKGCFELDRLYALEVAFIAEYLDSGSLPVRYTSESERSEACKELDGRLRSRCGGLLELIKRDPTDHIGSFCFCSAAEWPTRNSWNALFIEKKHDEWTDATVNFMHRTVYDFLNTDEAWQLGCLKTATVHFDIAAVMSLGHLYLATQSQRLRCPDELHQILTFLRDGISWGVEADQNSPDEEHNIFWKLSSFFDLLAPINDPLFESWCSHFTELSEAHSHDRHDLFSHATLIIAIEAGAVNYVKRHPSLRTMTSSSHLSCGCLPILYHAIAPKSLLGINPSMSDIMAPTEQRRNSYDMVIMLLAEGWDPNLLVPHGYEHSRNDGQTRSVWKMWLLEQCGFLSSKEGSHQTRPEQLAMLNTLEAFIRAGADLGSTQTEMLPFQRAVVRIPDLRHKMDTIMTLYEKKRINQERNWDRAMVDEDGDGSLICLRKRQRLSNGTL